MSLPLPSRIGKYELTEFLGGGMAQVYRAHDTVLGRIVALKILSESGNHDPEVRARFLQEAKMASSVAHDNIIAVYDFGEEQGRPYMVMEFLVGKSLREAIQDGETGDLQGKLIIALQIAAALSYIHAREIVHRDVKPDNIHIDATGKVKLMDFGIAKAQGSSLTRAGFTLGTPYYMAPEQVMGQQITPLVDIYAFGILLFELFSGAKPITERNVQQIFQKILHEPINLEPLRQRETPPEVIAIVQRCTMKNSAERWGSFEEIIAALRRLMDGQDPGPPEILLPGLLAKLPPSLRTQSGLILLSALGVLVMLSVMLAVARIAGVV